MNEEIFLFAKPTIMIKSPAILTDAQIRSFTDSTINNYETSLFTSEMISIDNLPSCIKDTTIVYDVFYDDVLRYIGSSFNGKRLQQHKIKLIGATKIDTSKVGFQFCMICDNRTDIALMVEKALIMRHDVPWDGSGFGRRPGEDNRETGPNAWGLEWGYDGYTPKEKLIKKTLPKRLGGSFESHVAHVDA